MNTTIPPPGPPTPPPSAVHPPGPGWWLAADGRWYPPPTALPMARHAPPRPTGNGIATAGMVVGILAVLVGALGILLFPFALLAVLAGVAAVVFGAIGRKFSSERSGLGAGQAAAGIATGIGGVLLGITGIVVFVLLIGGVLFAADDVFDSLGEEIEANRPAPSGAYELVDWSCSADNEVLTGRIENTSGRARGFRIVGEFTVADRSYPSTAYDDTLVLDDGEIASFEVEYTPWDSTEIVDGCRLDSVTEGYNR